jgi:hypothetical protein
VLPTARSLDDISRGGGITATFHPGSTALGHHWQLAAQDDTLLAHTARVHSGGKPAQMIWKFLSVTGLDANNDIHVELIGADNVPLVRASSSYSKETVTVLDPAGLPVARSKREKKKLSIYGADDAPVAELNCEGDGPWPVQSPAGEVLGELLAGEPGPSLSPELWHWVDPQWALNTATYARTMHLGLRRVKRYSLAPNSSGQALPAAVTLLPLLAGLTY